MKLKILILLTSISVAHAQSTSTLDRIAAFEAKYEALQAPAIQVVAPVYSVPIDYSSPIVVPQSIYSAYPNNPTLYRYLQNNPRMIPYYLGGQVGN